MLFKKQKFVSAAGLELTWRIECDDLTIEDWRQIAAISAPNLPPFKRALGVPRGGILLATELTKYVKPKSDITLVVDDVWTTGKSMNDFAKFHDLKTWVGFVAFSRGVLPPLVKCFMQCNFR